MSNGNFLSSVSELGSGLLHLFFPRLCAGCKQPLVSREEVICIACDDQLSRTNYHNAPENETVIRLAGRIPVAYATSLAYFTDESLLQHLIHGLKYKGKEQNGLFLGKELGKAINPLDWGIEAIVPVPLFRKKEFSRGYNQSLMIAEGIGEVLGVPVYSKAIVRVRHTESQTEKSREERVDNVKGAFQVRDEAQLRGKHILVVDDVLTTGATIEACALTILDIQDTRVSIATAGIAMG